MLERTGMAIRLRDPWEASDLGFILARTHWRALMAAWLSVALPLGMLVYGLLRNHLWAAPLVMWWLNPLSDRFLLHVLAKATFGEVPAWGDTLVQSPRLLRHGLLATLTWRRFSWQRSFVLPVWQLEEQGGPGYRRRCGVLLRRGHAQAVLLTLLFLLFHVAIWASLLACLSLFSPRTDAFHPLKALFASGLERVAWFDALLAFFPFLSTAVLEPFYVAGGFALYLNRRVELEGWDLEVAFRRAAERMLKAVSRGVRHGIGGGLALLLLLGLAPMALRAERPTPQEALAEVLREPEFQVKQKRKGLHWKSRAESKEPTRSQSTVSPGFITFLKVLGTFGKWLLIAGAVAGLAVLLWRSRSLLVRRLRTAPGEAPPELLFGLDIRPESLPHGLDRVAARLWAEGRVRAALALLYRGALAHLVHHRRASITRGATEGDCLRRATEVLEPASADYFGRLTRAWLRTAYADQGPEPGAESLCTEWPRHFRDVEGRP